jgi:upstream activation factor subunit UAF30
MPKANPTPKPAVNPKPTKPTKAVVPDIPVVPVVPDVPVIADKQSTRKPKKVKDAVVITKPAEPMISDEVVNCVVDSAAGVVELPTCDVQVSENFTNFFHKLQGLTALINTLKSEFRTLEKRSIRELKLAQKVNAKKKRKSGNRSPSGFVKPTLISDELANFLKKPLGSEMARTEVTREINTYIRAHSLQDKTNGRQINPDEPLSALLKVKEDEVLTYFNLQRYMSPHFAKSGVKV